MISFFIKGTTVEQVRAGAPRAIRIEGSGVVRTEVPASPDGKTRPPARFVGTLRQQGDDVLLTGKLVVATRAQTLYRTWLLAVAVAFGVLAFGAHGRHTALILLGLLAMFVAVIGATRVKALEWLRRNDQRQRRVFESDLRRQLDPQSQ